MPPRKQTPEEQQEELRATLENFTTTLRETLLQAVETALTTVVQRQQQVNADNQPREEDDTDEDLPENLFAEAEPRNNRNQVRNVAPAEHQLNRREHQPEERRWDMGFRVQSRARTDYCLQDGFLFRDNKMCVPEGSWRLHIIQELHNEGHVGRDRTIKLVMDSYFWPSMRRDVARFVERDHGEAVEFVANISHIHQQERFPVHEYNKLKARKIGPLEVVEKINANAYRILLPAHIRCSDVFNVKHLVPFVSSDDTADSGTNLFLPRGT
ncbi:hypothetical protein YC2023_074324 [Brassica napus]